MDSLIIVVCLSRPLVVVLTNLFSWATAGRMSVAPACIRTQGREITPEPGPRSISRQVAPGALLALDIGALSGVKTRETKSQRLLVSFPRCRRHSSLKISPITRNIAIFVVIAPPMTSAIIRIARSVFSICGEQARSKEAISAQPGIL